MPSHFTFLAAEWPALHEAAVKAEQMAHPDPRAACFYARRALEMAVSWLYKHDSALKLPYQAQGRVYVSTYPTMMRLIDETKDCQRRFGPGHFDLASSTRRTAPFTRSMARSSATLILCSWD